MAEQEEVQAVEQPAAPKSKKQTWEENLRAKYPDIEDEDEIYGMAMSGYDTEREANKKYAADNKSVFDKISENPDVSNFIGAVIKGENIGTAMSYLADLFPLEEGTPEFDAYVQGVEQRQKSKADNEKALSEFEANMEVTRQNLQAFVDSKGMSEEDAASFVEDLIDFERKLISGSLTTEDFEKYYKALSYDTDMEIGREAGEIEGKNEAIKTKRSKLSKGDALPNIQSTSQPETTPTIPMSKEEAMLESLAKRGDAIRSNY